MNVLVITNLFPNAKQPQRGVFNFQQLVALKKKCSLCIIAPVPWVPAFFHRKKDKVYREIPEKESIAGMETYHPRYVVTPKIGRALYGRLYYRGIKGVVDRLIREQKPDIIFATWAYPDGYAASLIAKVKNIPLVIKVHGTDINVLGSTPLLRQKMIKAFQRAKGIVAVSRSLKETISSWGINDRKVKLIENGVNKSLFYPRNKNESRQQLGLNANLKHIVYIGNLVEVKGIFYLIEAMRHMKEEYHLHLIGEGELMEPLKKKVKDYNLSSQVTFYGRKAHEEIPLWLSAADVFCLPSVYEGCPNVVLEALACGTSVVASHVGGISEFVDTEEKGTLVEPKNPKALAEALQSHIKMDNIYREGSLAKTVMSWEDNARKIREVLDECR